MTLFVVSTPIGNLEDFSFRARDVLQTVDLIAAEDKRRTAVLLARWSIEKPMVAMHDHNEKDLLEKLHPGWSYAIEAYFATNLLHSAEGCEISVPTLACAP